MNIAGKKPSDVARYKKRELPDAIAKLKPTVRSNVHEVKSCRGERVHKVVCQLCESYVDEINGRLMGGTIDYWYVKDGKICTNRAYCNCPIGYYQYRVAKFHGQPVTSIADLPSEYFDKSITNNEALGWWTMRRRAKLARYIGKPDLPIERAIERHDKSK